MVIFNSYVKLPEGRMTERQLRISVEVEWSGHVKKSARARNKSIEFTE